VEDGPSQGIYVAPEQVPQVGNVRVLLGEYGGHTSPIPAPSPLTYLDVVLGAGESWRFQPPAGQTVAWAFVYRGRATVCGEEVSRELAVLNESDATIDITAIEPSRVLFGSARKHNHPLVVGPHSVHTNEQSLANGIATIQRVHQELRQAGRL
jgi:redox-sensitive bicupin YhaK (pirin superfamily)